MQPTYHKMPKTYYLLKLTTPAPIQINSWHVYNNLTDIKRAIAKNLYDAGSLESFIWQQSAFLYLVRECQFISKIDIHPWIKILIEDICEVHFNPQPQVNFLSEDEENEELFEEMSAAFEYLGHTPFPRICLESRLKCNPSDSRGKSIL